MNTTATPPLLHADSLRKRYGEREAVRGISLQVSAGEVLGLLGPNGAGKSSTIAMLAGLSRPDGGSVTVGGTALAQDEFGYKRRIGLVPQELALFEDLPALANVELFGALYELPAAQVRARALEVLAQVGLADRAQDKPASFSGGMKRRLNIACALIHGPELLLLDEPTAGVDPQSRNAIFEQLEALKRAGMAIIYTTHYMEEVERLADRVLIIDHGQQVAHGSLAELYRLLPAAETLSLALDREIDSALEATLRALPGVQQLQRRGSQLQLGLSDLGQGSAAVLAALAAAGVAPRHISSGRANLEDVFLSLTGRQLRD